MSEPATKAELAARNAELEAELEALKHNAGNPAPVSPADDPLRPVSIMLFKDNGKYKHDLFIGINNKSWQIQRGVSVTVPFYVAQAILETQEQDAATARLIEFREMEFNQIEKQGIL